MSPRIIVSYDDTDNDRDALALARLFAYSGADLSLAYVRHAHQAEADHEAQLQRRAEQRLEHGAAEIGAPGMPRHVVVHASTGEGLIALARQEGADMVVFGSEYRTAPGSVRPGTSAQRLLSGGPVAVAVAPAELRSRPSIGIARIGVLAEGDEAATATAASLAAALGASVVEAGAEPVDLLVLGSRPEAPRGKVMLSAASEYEVETAGYPVLVVPRGVTLSFPAPPQPQSSPRSPAPPVPAAV